MNGLFSFKIPNFVEVLEILIIMKRINILLVFFFAFTSLLAQNSQTEKEEKSIRSTAFQSFGAQIDANDVITAAELTEKYANMKAVDTLQTKFVAKVTDVCQAKGCWMKLALEDGQETMVRFKDYGFFMPKDITGKEVIVNGRAFVQEMSIEDQKHYAIDAGKSAAEVTAINKPKKTLSFEADGVLVKE